MRNLWPWSSRFAKSDGKDIRESRRMLMRETGQRHVWRGRSMRILDRRDASRCRSSLVRWSRLFYRVVLARRFLSRNGRQTERDERQQQEHLRLGTHRHLGIPAHPSWLLVSISHSTVIGRLRHSSDASHSAARPVLDGPRLPSTSRWKQRLRPT